MGWFVLIATCILDICSVIMLRIVICGNIVWLQWQGMTSISVIEAGARWMNVKTISAGVDANAYLLDPVHSVVDGHRLALFAVSADEKLFFANNNVSTVYSPLLVPEDSGYNSGNLLLGLMI